ncbi:MAG: hypothetical protein RMK84_08295 [Oscillochloridaceae bacterium]|nr:hypothetical protein [Chloroflexaceae bacterium]MDW8390110.1 hypothetical protein [Oscillochloridaceae bacterium]
MKTGHPGAATPPRATALALRQVDMLVLGWSLIVPLVLFAIFHGYGFDDPYITYRYATNLADGHGFVYNPGERVLSTTAPLYALLLAPFAALGLEVPLISNLIGCVSQGAGALALWRLGRLAEMPLAGGAAAVLYSLSPYMALTLGAETTFFTAVTLWGFVALARGRPAVAGSLLAIATLTRADAALAAFVGGSALLLGDPPGSILHRTDADTPTGNRPSQRERPLYRNLHPLLRFGGAYALIVLPFLGAAWIYFGSPLPATLGAKRSQARIPGSRSYLAGLGQQLAGLVQRPLFWPLLGLAPLGLVTGLSRRVPLLLPLAWGSLHALAYSLLGVTAYFWYYSPAALALIIAAAMGAATLAAWLRQRRAARIGVVIVAVLIVMVLAAQVRALTGMLTQPDPRLSLYRAAGQWLAANTGVSDRVGALEVGIIGYYSGRPMVDFAGLIQPEVARVIAKGGSYDAAARQAISVYRPAYLVNQETALPLVSSDLHLANRCLAVAAFPDPRYPSPLTIYRCVWQEGGQTTLPPSPPTRTAAVKVLPQQSL